VLLEVGPQHWGTDRFRETPKRPPSDKLELIDGGGGIYRDASEPALSTWRRVYYIGKRQAANTFIALSRDASLALENTDIPALRDVPPDTTRSRGLRWVWTVFDLAWQKSPGTALKADKRLWCGTTKFPHVQPPEGTFFRKLWDKFYEKGGWSDYPPDCFCSELNDVFTSSAYACDIMLSLTDEQVEAKISEARNVDRLISAELRKSLAAFKAHLETGVRCKRSVPNVGDVDCVEIRGDDAVEQLQTLRGRLAVAVEQAYDAPHLRSTADLLATARPFSLLGPDATLNFWVPHVGWVSSAKSRPFAEYVRAEMLDMLDKALARLQFGSDAVATEPVKLPMDSAILSSKRREHSDAGGKRQATSASTHLSARHSLDFRSVRWHGKDYTFTPTQAAIVTELWAAWEQGTPDIGDPTLLRKADCAGDRLRDVFKNHPAWGTMIVEGQTKGTRRLRPSQS
jgi:hypothetical protein